MIILRFDHKIAVKSQPIYKIFSIKHKTLTINILLIKKQ